MYYEKIGFRFSKQFFTSQKIYFKQGKNFFLIFWLSREFCLKIKSKVNFLCLYYRNFSVIARGTFFSACVRHAFTNKSFTEIVPKMIEKRIIHK